MAKENPAEIKIDFVTKTLVDQTITDLFGSFKDNSNLSGMTKSGLLAGLTAAVTMTPTFGDKHRLLTPFVKDKAISDNDAGERLGQLVDDLEILTTFEREGIEGINDRIDKSFKQLQTKDLAKEEQEKAITSANRYLYRAIYLFPHLVNSIEVQLDDNAAKAGVSDQMLGKYYEPNRYTYEKLHNLRVDAGDSDLNTLIIPLPYGFTTGTHGSGERAAMGQFSREIYFGLEHRNGQPEYDPALFIVIEAPLISSRETTFLPQELKSLKLSQRADFTPYEATSFRDGPLISRGHPVDYYLGFRNFTDNSSGRKLHQGENLTILEPYKNDRSLWNDDYHGGRSVLKKGFFATCSQKAEETVLYEVENYFFSGSSHNDESLTKMFEDIIYPRVVHPKKYLGNDIIGRLARIPVKPRHF